MPRIPVLPAVRPWLVALVLLGSVSGEARAYIDPGTGSLLIQGFIAAVAGAMAALRLYWGRVKAFLARRPPAAADERETTTAAPTRTDPEK